MTSEADARSAAALDTVRNIEGRVASLAAELTRFETQARVLFDVVRVSSETARTLVIDTQPVAPLPVTNVTVTQQPRQRRVTLILDRRIAAAGLVTLALIGLVIAPSLRRIDQIGAAPLAAPPPVAASVPIPSRTTDITLPLEAPKAPEPTPRRPSSRRPSVNQPRAVAFVGSLAVYSNPPGATVLVDGRSSGVTPLQVARLPAGSHVVWLERDGYERWTNAVHVPANKVTHVTAKLEALRTARSPQN